MPTPLPASGPNAQQIQHWNEQAGPKWVALQNHIDAMIRPLGHAVMQRMALKAGESVLDIGCGCGDTTLDLARQVAPGGAVTGVDISAVMLQCAQQRAQAAELADVRFVNADAQTHRFEPASFDVAFSRFGVMFFAQPEAAFANIRSALRAGGRLAFLCWQPLSENPWAFVPMMAALQHIPAPPMPEPGAPGPFAFGDAERVRAILSAAGFSGIDLAPLRETVSIGGGAGLDEVVDFTMQMGPAALALRSAEPSLRDRVAGAMREALQPYVTAAGVQMPSAAWVVTAVRPA